MNLVYPARFSKEQDNSYSVEFPDIQGAFTCGKDLQEAIEFAEDCLGGVLVGLQEDGKDLPVPSSIEKFEPNTEKVFINLIKINLKEYKKLIDDKPIKKTVYIPNKLNIAATTHGLNCSQLLRDAIQEAIG